MRSRSDGLRRPRLLDSWQSAKLAAGCSVRSRAQSVAGAQNVGNLADLAPSVARVTDPAKAIVAALRSAKHGAADSAMTAWLVASLDGGPAARVVFGFLRSASALSQVQVR